jgi:hypothetical protein
MKKIFYLISALILLITSCTERIDIDLDETYTRLVVYGTITTDTTTHYVQLTKTTSYYYTEAPPAVSGARVEISDEEGNVISLVEEEPGLYATSPLFHAVNGTTYTLRVDLQEEINGHKTYTATSTVTPIYPIDSISLIFQPDWGENGFYEVGCYYQDPSTKDFYMFNIFKNGELLTDTISNRFISSDEFYNGSYTNGIGVGYLDQSYERETLAIGDTVTFQGCNISEEYYNYIIALQTETNFQTPLFSGPPANVKGNISNGAAGFFAAYGVAYSSKVFQPQ